MRELQVLDRDSNAAQTNSRHSGQLSSETLHVRSYDHQCAYDVYIELVDDGDTLFETRYYLLPGQTESELGVVPTGTYELHVTLDNRSHDTVECHIGPSTDHTAVVEVGNGTFALTEGLVD